MLRDVLRPWGELKWLFDRSPNLNWSLLGCISFEHRCFGVQVMLDRNNITNQLFFDIVPPEGRTDEEQKKRLRQNKKVLQDNGLTNEQIATFSLLEGSGRFMNEGAKFLNSSNGNVILDISCLPKRFFFPILKLLVSSDHVNNLLVTYSKPKEYSKEALAKDPAEWKHLPGFMYPGMPEPHADLAIIGVGFMPLGLSSLLTGKYKDAEVKLLFPYPPGPPHYQRNWSFVGEIDRKHQSRTDVKTMNRVHTLNMSDAYDQICALTNGGAKHTILAPYGPKPISTAMALYAIKYNAPVFYTQPTTYAHDYSSGVKESYGYWIKMNGVTLY